jgi:hypothetical protein
MTAHVPESAFARPVDATNLIPPRAPSHDVGLHWGRADGHRHAAAATLA